MDEHVFKLEVLRGAIKSAQSHAGNAYQMRNRVVFYLQCLEHDYRRARDYRKAQVVRAMTSEVANAPLTRNVLVRYKEQAAMAVGLRREGYSNTPPTGDDPSNVSVDAEGKSANSIVKHFTYDEDIDGTEEWQNPDYDFAERNSQ